MANKKEKVKKAEKAEKVEKVEKGFGVIHQYTKDLSFENLLSAKELLKGEFSPTGDIQLNLLVEKVDDSVSEVTLKFKIEAKDEEKKKSIYILELEYSGLVLVQGFPEEEAVPLLMVEAPRLMFPFAREVIASATSGGGFVPLTLKPVDFLGMFMEQAQNNN